MRSLVPEGSERADTMGREDGVLVQRRRVGARPMPPGAGVARAQAMVEQWTSFVSRFRG